MKLIQLLFGLVSTLTVTAYTQNLRSESTACICTTVPCPVEGANYLTEGNF